MAEPYLVVIEVPIIFELPDGMPVTADNLAKAALSFVTGVGFTHPQIKSVEKMPGVKI